MTTQEVKRKLTVILNADVKGCSRLKGKMGGTAGNAMDTKGFSTSKD